MKKADFLHADTISSKLTLQLAVFHEEINASLMIFNNWTPVRRKIPSNHCCLSAYPTVQHFSQELFISFSNFSRNGNNWKT